METRYIKRLIVLISSELEPHEAAIEEESVEVSSSINSSIFNSIKSDKQFLLKAKKVFTFVLKQQISEYDKSHNLEELRVIRWIITFCKNPALCVRQTQYVTLLPMIIALINNVED